MKKIILFVSSLLVLMSIFSSTLSARSDVKYKVSNAFGVGINGMTYRKYRDNGYIDYSGSIFYRSDYNERFSFSADVNIGKYLYTSKNDNLDFAIKYAYGLSTRYGRDTAAQFSNNDSYRADVHIMFGAEVISPHEEGFVIDVMVGQKIQYDDKGDIVTSTTEVVQFMFNY